MFGMRSSSSYCPDSMDSKLCLVSSYKLWLCPWSTHLGNVIWFFFILPIRMVSWGFLWLVPTHSMSSSSEVPMVAQVHMVFSFSETKKSSLHILEGTSSLYSVLWGIQWSRRHNEHVQATTQELSRVWWSFSLCQRCDPHHGGDAHCWTDPNLRLST